MDVSAELATKKTARPVGTIKAKRVRCGDNEFLQNEKSRLHANVEPFKSQIRGTALLTEGRLLASETDVFSSDEIHGQVSASTCLRRELQCSLLMLLMRRKGRGW